MSHIEIDFYLLKPLIKLFIKAGALSDLDITVDYPKKLIMGSIFKTSRSNEIGPPVFTKRGGRMGFGVCLAGLAPALFNHAHAIHRRNLL